MSQLAENVQFVNPAAGTELTVYFSLASGDTDTETTKYLDLNICKKVQIRSNKVFKVTKINGSTLKAASTSGTTNKDWEFDGSGFFGHITSIAFEPEEASGNFEVLGFSGGAQ